MSSTPTHPGSPTPRLVQIFVAALAIRWVYDIAIYTAMGTPGLMGTDSDTYLGHSINLATAFKTGTLSGWEWFGSTEFIMPLFRWLLALNVLLFGKGAVIGYVLMQGVMDALVCVLISLMARELHPKWQNAAGFIAAANLTQIVLAGILYTDTLFLLVVTLFLYAAVRWLMRPSYGAASLIGIGLGAALFTRVLIAPWAVALLLFMVIASAIQRMLNRRRLTEIVLAAAIFAVFMGSMLANNVNRWGTWALTAQTGMHMAFWMVPLIQEAHDGTPWRTTYERMWNKVQTHYGPESDDMFERSRHYQAIAREEMRKFSIADFTKAWLIGAAINIGSPAIILSPPVSSLPRTGFYGTAASTFTEKVRDFLFHSDNAAYAWVLIAGLVGLALIRVVELAGLFVLFKRRVPLAVLALLGGWCAYILLVNGPVGSPKYRLPMEPVFVTLTAAGLVFLRNRRSRSAETM